MASHGEIAGFAGVGLSEVRRVLRAIKLLTATELARTGRSENTLFRLRTRRGEAVEMSPSPPLLRAIVGDLILEDLENEFLDSDDPRAT